MTNSENKKSSKKMKPIKKDYEEHIINDFTKKNIFETIFSGISVFKYKIALYWIPLIIYLAIIYIYTLLDIDITGTKDLNYVELFTAVLSGFIIFIIYTLIDFIYQRIICKNTTFGIDLLNSITNASVPAMFVFTGYLIAIILPDINKYTLNHISRDNEISLNEAELVKKSSSINTQSNNILIACIFYIFALFYRNPINKPNCSSNNICNYQEDIKSKQNKQM